LAVKIFYVRKEKNRYRAVRECGKSWGKKRSLSHEPEKERTLGGKELQYAQTEVWDQGRKGKTAGSRKSESSAGAAGEAEIPSVAWESGSLRRRDVCKPLGREQATGRAKREKKIRIWA